VPPQITCACALPGKTGKSHFSLNTALVDSTVHAVCCLPERKSSSMMCLIASTFVEIVRYPINIVRWQAWWRTTPTFYTATDTVTDLVNIEHVSNRQQDSRSCLVHPVDSCDSEGRFSCNQVIFYYVSCVFGKTSAFKWKDAIFGFSVSPGSAEAVVRWVAKIKYILIAYFLGNASAKNYRNRTVHVKIIASQRWDVFWDTV